MTKFKVGDKVYDIVYGLSTVKAVDSKIIFPYPILLHNGRIYTSEGRDSEDAINPTLLTLDEARAKGYEVPKQKVKKQRTVWLNVYEYMTTVHEYKNIADDPYYGKRLDCVEVAFDYEVTEWGSL
jgi:hypothetical protein